MLTTDKKDAIAEAEIAAAAVRLGMGVDRPMFEGGRYDLILEVGATLMRVQYNCATRDGGAVVVRCFSSRRGPDRMIVRTYTADEVDAIAAYCRETDRCYLLLPLPFRPKNVYLGVAPSRNIQRGRHQGRRFQSRR